MILCFIREASLRAVGAPAFGFSSSEEDKPMALMTFAVNNPVRLRRYFDIFAANLDVLYLSSLLQKDVGIFFLVSISADTLQTKMKNGYLWRNDRFRSNAGGLSITEAIFFSPMHIFSLKI